MTDPLSGPPGSGSTGGSGVAPGSGRGSTGSGAAHGTVPAPVPQQYEPGPEEREQYERQQYQRAWGGRAEETAAPGVRVDDLLATAARQSWPAVLAGSLAMIALGVILLVWPNASLTVVAILIGAAILVSGLVRLWGGLTASDVSGGMRAAYVAIGLLAIFAGLYLLRHHALSLFLVTFLVSVYFIAHGVADIGVALSTRVPARGVRAVMGVFSLAAGIVILIWPAITLVLLLTIAAAWLLFYGLALGFLAFSLWRAGRELSRRSSSQHLETSAA